MCVGIPMQVISIQPDGAVCDWRGEKRLINTLLIGELAPGDWVLTFLDQAREVISASQAQQIQQALEALELVANGNHNVDHLFADLVDREPELPDFLKPEFEKKNRNPPNMRSPQLQRLVDVNEIPVLDEAGIEAFAQQHPQVMLFFSEDPDRYPEANDVAMVVPELVKAFPGHLAAAIVDERVERELKLQYGFRRWPALVFLRGEGYLGAITEMQNWDDYLHQVQAILAAEVSKPPLALLDVSNADS